VSLPEADSDTAPLIEKVDDIESAPVAVSAILARNVANAETLSEAVAASEMLEINETNAEDASLAVADSIIETK
jgi:hypothetical protein